MVLQDINSRLSRLTGVIQRACKGPKWKAHAFVTLLMGHLSGCGFSECEEYTKKFELSRVLSGNSEPLLGRWMRFQIVDRHGDPIPWCLLQMEWDDGGRLSFQTDQDGVLSMQFEQDILEYQVWISADSEDSPRIRLCR